jgi:XTP/dITP diphosphohydrolase
MGITLRRLGLRVKRLHGKGLEIQSNDIREVAKFACTDASRKYRRRLIVEDSGLFIGALHGFPGPYSSFVFRTIGLGAILKLLTNVEDRAATFRSVVAYCEPGGKPRAFRGSMNGEIATRAAGSSGFGFDPIFIPRGQKLTVAEMTLDEKCRISHRAEAAARFGRWYLDHHLSS